MSCALRLVCVSVLVPAAENSAEMVASKPVTDVSYSDNIAQEGRTGEGGEVTSTVSTSSDQRTQRDTSIDRDTRSVQHTHAMA